jgi:hypothetical protein
MLFGKFNFVLYLFIIYGSNVNLFLRKSNSVNSGRFYLKLFFFL